MPWLLVCDHCEKRERVNRYDDTYLGTDYTWIEVSANEDADCGAFCSWACLAAWAVNKGVEKGVRGLGEG